MLSTRLFRDSERAKQLVSFDSLEFGMNNYPTDVDALFEWRDKLYIIVELKFNGSAMRTGQELSLTRLVNDLSTRKPAILVMATHNTPFSQPVDLGVTRVTKVFWQGHWREPKDEWTVRAFMEKFIEIYGRKL